MAVHAANTTALPSTADHRSNSLPHAPMDATARTNSIEDMISLSRESMTRSPALQATRPNQITRRGSEVCRGSLARWP